MKPYINDVVNDVRIKVVRVENETDWVLSRAYNLAVRQADVAFVFKVDCDYVVEESAVEKHRLDRIEGEQQASKFYTGYYMNARDANEMHLNGVLMVSQKDFWAVGGYDERIQSYGYDDEELYTRLAKAGIKRLNVSYQEVSHLQHGDEERRQAHVTFPRAHIDMNRLMLEKIDNDWVKDARRSEYQRVNGKTDLIKAVFIPRSLEQRVNDKERNEMWKLALGRRLNNDYKLPWAVISEMPVDQMENMLQNLNDMKLQHGGDEVIEQGNSVRWVVVHVMNGLGNRLRVLASGLAFARKTNRVPLIVWEKSVHFGAFFGDIFNQTSASFAVIPSWSLNWPLTGYEQYDVTWKDVVAYNYMHSNGTGVIIKDDKEKNIYFRSASIMKTDGLTSWESENAELRKLRVHGYITGLASAVTKSGFKHVCGVHIRNRSLDEDIIGVEDNRKMYEKEDAALLDKWRAVTTYVNFVDKMDSLLKEGEVRRFFVASDTLGVLQKVQDIFGKDKVEFIERTCEDRSGKCEQYAMADVLVLSKTRMLLGSTWSSFTEAVMRMGGPKALMAGTDFGVKPEDDESEKR